MARRRCLDVLTFIPILLGEKLRGTGQSREALFAMWCLRRRLRWHGWDEVALAPIHPRFLPATREDWNEMIDYIVDYTRLAGIVPKRDPLPGTLAARVLILVGRQTFERVFGQILADMRDEHFEAISEGNDAEARKVVHQAQVALFHAALALLVPRWLATAYRYIVGAA